VGGSKAVSDAPQAGTPAAGDGRPDAKPTFSKSQEKKATLEDRKRQIAQLAAMGIAVPDQVRGEFAQAGEWQVVSEKIIGEDGKEQKGLSTGVRKRKLDEEEQEQIAAAETITKKKGWGNTFKRFPGRWAERKKIWTLCLASRKRRSSLSSTGRRQSSLRTMSRLSPVSRKIPR
jgi:uncharacterized protein YifE (UPF0438 family)